MSGRPAWTWLLFACLRGHAELVTKLIAANANVNQAHTNGGTQSNHEEQKHDTSALIIDQHDTTDDGGHTDDDGNDIKYNQHGVAQLKVA